MGLKEQFHILIAKHRSAIQTDTLLGQCEDDNRYLQLERKAEKFWQAYYKAESDFLMALPER